jgi:subtilisin family serine protease
MLISFTIDSKGDIPIDTVYVQWPIPDSLLKIKDEAIIKFKPNALYLDKLCYNILSNENKDSITSYIMSQQFLIDSIVGSPDLREAIKMYGGIYLKRITSASPCVDTFSISRYGDTILCDDFLWMVLKFNNDTSLINACVMLTQFYQNYIESAEPNIYLLQDIPASDCFYKGEGLNCPALQNSLYPDFTNVESAYDWIGISKRRDIKVAIIDDGIWYQHPDLNGDTIRKGPVVYKWNYLTNDPVINANCDHGTQIAGIIAAQTNSVWNWPHTGIAGIVGDWLIPPYSDNPVILGVQLYGLKVGNYFPAGEIRADAMMNAVYHASRNNPISGNGLGVHIINSSFGISNYYEYVGIHKAYNFAYENGVSLVCSRGNSGTDAGHYPATFDPSWITSVGALDANHRKADFSSFGLGMDFLAPGTSDLVFTTYPNNEWGYVEGTSFAAPHVTGAIAALRALFISPNNPFNPFGVVPEPEDYENMLKAAATDLNYGYDENARKETLDGYDLPTGWGELKIGHIFEMLMEGYVLKHYYISDPYNMEHDEYKDHHSIPSLTVDNATVSRVTPGIYSANQRAWTGYLTLEDDWTWDENSNLYVWGYGGRSYSGGLGPSLYVCMLPCGKKGGFNYLFSSPYTEVISGTGGNGIVNGIIHNDLNVVARTYQYELISVNNNGVITPLDPPVIIRPDAQINFRISVFGRRNTTSVQDNQYLDISCIYPNPATSNISFKFKLASVSMSEVRLYNSLGITVYEESYGVLMPDIYNKTINISSLPAGFYILELKNGESFVRNKVIIIK